MRAIDEIIIHCTATAEGREVSIEEITRWHKEQGYAAIGYHYVVSLDGKVHPGRGEHRIGAHCLGHNASSIGVCYVGGLTKSGKPKDTRTPAQKKALLSLLRELRVKYPKASIHGHNEYSNKSCPCFDAPKEYKDL